MSRSICEHCQRELRDCRLLDSWIALAESRLRGAESVGDQASIEAAKASLNELLDEKLKALPSAGRA